MSNEKEGILRYERPALTADCVLFTTIEDEKAERNGKLNLQVRLVKRTAEPEKDKWALLGAFVPVEERIEDVMRTATLNKGGYDGFYAEQLFTFDTPGRDERWRVVSVAYLGIAKMYQGITKKAEDAYWFDIDFDESVVRQRILGLEIPFDELAFDHGDILKVALDRLRAKATYTDIALNFLDEPYRIKDIKRVMEAIMQKKCDNIQRVFERYIEKIEDGRSSGEENSKAKMGRPAALYRKKTKTKHKENSN